MKKFSSIFALLIAFNLFGISKRELNRLIGQARRFESIGQYDSALVIYSKIYEVAPKQSFSDIVRVAKKLKDFKTIILYSKKELKNNPEDKNIMNHLITAYRELGNLKGAIKELKKLRNQVAYEKIGDIYAELGNFKSAEKYYSKGRAYYKLGLIYKDKSPAEAVKYFKKLPESDKTLKEIFYCYLKLMRISSAKKLARNIKSPDLRYYLLGNVFYYSGDFDSARIFYNYIGSESNYFTTAFLRQLIIINNINIEELAKISQAEYYNEIKDPKQALAILNTISDSSVIDEALYLKGKIYAQLGEYKKSIEAFTQFIETYENYLVTYTYYELGEVYTKLGDYRKAKDIYKEFLVNYPTSPIAPVIRARLERLED